MDKKLKIKTFHALLARTGLISYKHDMLGSYGVESTSDLECWELDELIDKLRQQESEQRREHDAELRNLRSTVLTILQRMGIYQDNGSWDRVNKYLTNPRIAGKVLYRLTADEMRELIRKLRTIERKQKAQKANIDRMVINN
jgi:hypothetical protein